MIHGLTRLTRELLEQHRAAGTLWLDIGGVGIRVRSSSPALLTMLRDYFGERVSEQSVRAEIEFLAIQAPPPSYPVSFHPWPREERKSEPKELFADAPGVRLVRKRQSGLCFLLTPREVIAVGPCLENPNQLINCVVSRYVSGQLHRGWSLCHAAAVTHGDRGVAIAARAGGGKSTLALHLMSGGLSFVSNDRLLIRRSSAGAEALGVPKMPRVNAGTLLHNPDLARILPGHRREQLARLAPKELWELEEKYDVIVDRIFGRGRTRHRARLCAVVILDWAADAKPPARFSTISLDERRDLLELLMKSPSVFHHDEHGRFAAATARPEPNAYLQALSGVPVIEVTGRADFPVAVGYCRQLLGA